MGCLAILKFIFSSITLFMTAVILMAYFDFPNNAPALKTEYDRNITLHDGRTFSYADYGSPTGDVIVFFHGTPGCRLYPWGDSPHLSLKDIRVISIDRPGFGQSTWNPKFSLASFVDDVGQLMDHLNVSKFSLLGVSGGAPYTYAAIYTIPQRIKSALIISGMGPVNEIGKCPEMMQPILSLYKTSQHIYKGMIWFMRQTIYYIYAFGLDEAFLESQKESLVPADAKALEDPALIRWNNQATREGLRQGSVALAAENALFFDDWGFQLADIEYDSLSIWHGEKDPNAPPYLAHFACDHINTAKCKFFENGGHLLFWNLETEIYKQLINK